MNTVLLIIGILGIGAILIAAYVFTVAARNYVSDGQSSGAAGLAEDDNRLYIVRSSQDRRQHTGNLTFPLTLQSGEVIEHDRRSVEDRRASGA